MEEAEAKADDPDFVAYMEAVASEFKKASTWEGIIAGRYCPITNPSYDNGVRSSTLPNVFFHIMVQRSC